MTAAVARCTGAEAYDLIYRDHLAKLSDSEQEIMQRHMMNSYRCWVGYEDDKVLCFLGIIPPTVLSDCAYLWLYTTEHLTEHVFIFVRYSQRIVQEMLSEFPTIVGHCEINNLRAQRWLRWLGAKFGEPIEGKALPFTIVRVP